MAISIGSMTADVFYWYQKPKADIEMRMQDEHINYK